MKFTGIALLLCLLMLGCSNTERVQPLAPDPPDPELCIWSIICELPPDPDFNVDGGIDGADVEEFFYAWGDGIMLDRNGDGCPETDSDLDGICDWCDIWRFFVVWEAGGLLVLWIFLLS